MAVTTTPEAGLATSAPARRPWLHLTVALAVSVPYVVGLVVPYYAHDLHLRPAGEHLYMYDMGQMWPWTSALAPFLALAIFFGAPLAPFVGLWVFGWTSYALWVDRRTQTLRTVVPLVAAAAVALTILVFMVTPLAGELFAWFID